MSYLNVLDSYLNVFESCFKFFVGKPKETEINKKLGSSGFFGFSKQKQGQIHCWSAPIGQENFFEKLN